MIVGVGVDLVEVERIEAALRHPRFRDRILTPDERSWGTSARFVAGRWAAKEAIYKALGMRITWQQVEILPDALGVPQVHLHHPDFDPGRLRIHVSISHERRHAVAVAVVDRLVMQRSTV